MSSRSRQVIHTVLTRFARVALGAATGIVIARSLHAEGRGAYAAVVAVASMAQSVGHMSVEQAHTALWRRARASIPSNSLLLGPAVGTFAGTAALIIVLLLGPRAVPLPSYGLLLVALAAVPLGMTVLYVNSVLVLQGRLNVVNRASLVAAVGQCGALLGFAFTGTLTVGVVVWVWTIAAGLPLVMLVPAMRPRLRDVDRRLAGATLTYGLRYHLAFAALYLLLRLDVLLLNGLSTPTAVGLYSLAVTIAELAWIVTDAAAQVALARQADTELADAAAVTLAATRTSALLSAVAVAGMCLTAPVLVPLLYGPGFAGSVPALMGLAVGIFALGATRPVNGFLVRLNRPVVSSAISLSAVAANVVLCLVLIPRWGVVGCGLASSGGYAILGGAQVAWFLRATGTPARRLLPGRADLDRLTRPGRRRARVDA
ncbi:oligosaccharide flippase family protein [Planosporangium thailandense]|uniref:Oligosaccharide flippase family protein n=1 Tax=Planosporangium thailandense TaxID=765197 RepID=A0ABX0YA83_9ACTN|nr:polysaccharide biosynthesis C-terminal domain-containing protein [Planosporangium thailandense]NJC74292.1 oligosaccharide flippase family protein [Planosporangium thailandense]